MNFCKTQFIFIFILSLTCVHSYSWAAKDKVISIDHELAQKISDLEKNPTVINNFYGCQITSSFKALEKDQPNSYFTPYEITLYYENQEITSVLNSRGEQGKELDGLELNCVENNNHIYLFLDTSFYETRLKFNLTERAYVVYSSDKGQTWSDLKSLQYLSQKSKFAIPHQNFAQRVTVFSNNTDHALSIYNKRDETTYLLGPDLEVLRSVPVYNRLSSLSSPRDFTFHKDTIYLVHDSCAETKNKMKCPDLTYFETSKDFGKTWQREERKSLLSSQFIRDNDKLYHLTLTQCRRSWWKPPVDVFPALNKNPVCGLLNISELNDDDSWTKPKLLIKTVSRLNTVYREDKPIVSWQDFRFHKRRACGFVPFVGCVDSVAFDGPTVTYAGELDLETLNIKESIIDYKQQL